MSNPPIPDVKDQHYIPKFYLKGFTDKKGNLWVCEKFKPIRTSKPKREAHRPDYYTHAEKGQRDETVENALKETESRVAPIIRKLANPQYVLTPENANHLNIFVALMFARVPSWRENLDKTTAQIFKDTLLRKARDKEKFHKLCADIERSTEKSQETDYEKLRQYVLKGEFDMVQKSVAFNLGAMFKSAFTILGELENYSYQGLYAPEGKCFLTSDSPVYTIQPDGKGQATIGIGFGRPGVEVYFPLNKRTCLRMEKGIQPKGKFVDERRVEQINDLTMVTAARYLYSSEGCRRTARLFDERGCKVRPGKESFLLTPPSGHGIL